MFLLGGQMQEFQVQISRLEAENRKLTTEKEQITAEKDRLSHDIQMLNHRVTALMRQFSNQQVCYIYRLINFYHHYVSFVAKVLINNRIFINFKFVVLTLQKLLKC